jgi:cytochrome c-type biogenesis protein CcmH
MRVIANEGVVDAEAEGIFNRMLREEPGAPQARYYLALAKAQRGDEAGALVDWRALLADTPEDAPWRQALQARIAEASGLPAAPPPPQRPADARGPTKEQVEAAQSMQPGDQQAMIENMVSGLAERLKQNPNDLDGWRRLARAYDVLGREAEARRAHERVLALSPNDPASLWSLGQYAKQRGDKAEARRRWQALERALPKDAPERGDVQRALQSL